MDVVTALSKSENDLSELHKKNKLLNGKQTDEKPDVSIKTYRMQIKWINVIALSLLHLLAIWTLFNFPYLQNLRLFLWAFVVAQANIVGVTAGVHRLWCHRSYNATLPLRILLMVFYTSIGMNNIYDWVRDHKIHHKYSDTDADPHNASRGFFFSHIGWLMVKRHPEVIRRGKEVDMSELLTDPVVRFQRKYHMTLKILLALVIPSIIPPLCWGQDWFWSFMMCMLRICYGLNTIWLINSAAHLWGMKPYNKNIYPSENLPVSMVSLGEGWHNYHHAFPWDSRASELGKYFNFTGFCLNLFEKFGMAYDFKTVSMQLIKRTADKHGDGSFIDRKNVILETQSS